VYANSWMSVREDSVIRPDGQPGVYGVVEIRPSVGIVALDDSDADGHGDGDRIALVSQWRYTLGKMSLEIPTGGSEPGEPLLAAAARELAEEAGLSASSWAPLGFIDNSNGVTTDVSHMFLATGLTQGQAAPDPTEKIELSWRPFAAAVADVLRGAITESVSVAAILKVELLKVELLRQDFSRPGTPGRA
jgi:8-oxo-dGTP pyrophosphatase MutT (NUDIX family)